MIEARGLSRRYGDRWAVQEVSFTVAQGEILGFLGPNGAGKTTTMRMLTGYLPPTDGTAVVAGFDVVKQPLEVKRRIGYLPEWIPLYDDMTVWEYLGTVARLKGMPRRQIDDAIERSLNMAGLDEVADRLVRNLSRGYKQRVGLAQALVHDPPVLILDEPTSSLDPKQIVEIRRVIKSLAGRYTVILSTHILPEVSVTCDRVIIINQGRIVAVDTPEALAQQLQKSERTLVRVGRGGHALAARLREIPGVKNVDARDGAQELVVESELGTDVREQVARAAVEAGAGLLELRPISLSLEDVFVRLVTREEEVEA